MVSGDGFTWGAFVVLHPVEALKIDQVVVQVVDGCVRVRFKCRIQELRHHRQPSILSVNGCCNRVEFIDHVGGVPVLSENGVRTTGDGFFSRTDVVGEGDVGLVHGGPLITKTRGGELVGARNRNAIFVNPVKGGRGVKHTCRVRVSFCHDDVPVGLDDVVGSVVNEVNHGIVEDGFHLNKVGHLLIVEVFVDRVDEGGREHGGLTVCRCIISVAFGELPYEHRRDVVLATSKKHVSSRRNTGLEVVRNRGVFTGAHGLETVVPPRHKGWFFRVFHLCILIR